MELPLGTDSVCAVITKMLYDRRRYGRRVVAGTADDGKIRLFAADLNASKKARSLACTYKGELTPGSGESGCVLTGRFTRPVLPFVVLLLFALGLAGVWTGAVLRAGRGDLLAAVIGTAVLLLALLYLFLRFRSDRKILTDFLSRLPEECRQRR